MPADAAERQQDETAHHHPDEHLPLNIRLIEPFKIALGVVPEATNVLIRIHTSDGLYGLGEASPFWFITGDAQATGLEAARLLAQLLIGKNPLAIESRMG